MTRPIKGWFCRVIEFPTSPEGAVTCIWFRTTASLLCLMSQPRNPQHEGPDWISRGWAPEGDELWAAMGASDKHLQWGLAGGMPEPSVP
jgi:hypothetical protein